MQYGKSTKLFSFFSIKGYQAVRLCGKLKLSAV